MLPSCVQKERKLKLLQELLSQLREKLLNVWDSFFSRTAQEEAILTIYQGIALPATEKWGWTPGSAVRLQKSFLLYDHWAILLKIL